MGNITGTNTGNTTYTNAGTQSGTDFSAISKRLAAAMGGSAPAAATPTPPPAVTPAPVVTPPPVVTPAPVTQPLTSTATTKDYASQSKDIVQNAQSSAANMMSSSLTDLFFPKKTEEAPSAYQSPLLNTTPDYFSQIWGVPASAPAPETIEQKNFNIGQPFAKAKDGAKTEPIPSTYDQYLANDPQGRWVAPSDQAVLRNWPELMGGGQYIIDPSQPGKLIKSTRKEMDWKLSPGAEQAALGELSPRLFQVDHIIPLWIGGADTAQNLEIIANPDHRVKTAIQAVPYTLYINGKITLDEARVMATTWEQHKDNSNIPTQAEIDKVVRDKNGRIIKSAGEIDLDKAQKIAKSWSDDLTKPITSVFDKRALAQFGPAWKETMQNFGKDVPVLGEFSKGFVGSFGVPDTQALESSGMTGKVSNFLGQLTGTVTEFGIVAKVLTKMGAFGQLAKASAPALTSITGVGLPFMTEAGMGLTKSTIAANKNLIAENLSNLSLKNFLKTGLLKDYGSLGNVSSGALARIGASALTFGVQGQMVQTINQLTDGNDMTAKEVFQSHIDQALKDAFFGSALGYIGGWSKGGQTLQGYGAVGTIAYSMALMNGASVPDAAKEGIIMAALHGMGWKNRNAPDPLIKSYETEVNKIALSKLYEKLGPDYIAPPDNNPNQKFDLTKPLVLPLPVMEKLRVQMMAEFPDMPLFKNIGVVDTQGKAFNVLAQASLARTDSINAKREAAGEVITPEEKAQQKREVTTAVQQLYNWSLVDPAAKTAKTIKDFKAVGEAIRPVIERNKGEAVTAGLQKQRAIFSDQGTIDPSVIANLNKLKGQVFPGEIKSIEANVPLTGQGKVELLTKNQETLAQDRRLPEKQQVYGDKYIIIKNEDAASVLRSLEIDSKVNPSAVDINMGNVDNPLYVFAISKDGKQALLLGNVPLERSFNDKDFPLNKPFFDEYERFVKKIESVAGDTLEAQIKDLRAKFEDDIAKIDLSSDTKAEQVLNLRKNLRAEEPRPTTELYKVLKPEAPMEYYDPKFNNETFAAQMRDLNSNFLIVSEDKNWPKDVAKVKGKEGEYRPFPFTSIKATKQDTHLTKAINEAVSKEPRSISKGISNIVNKAKALKMSKEDLAGLKDEYEYSKGRGEQYSRENLLDTGVKKTPLEEPLTKEELASRKAEVDYVSGRGDKYFQDVAGEKESPVVQNLSELKKGDRISVRRFAMTSSETTDNATVTAVSKKTGGIEVDWGNGYKEWYNQRAVDQGWFLPTKIEVKPAVEKAKLDLEPVIKPIVEAKTADTRVDEAYLKQATELPVIDPVIEQKILESEREMYTKPVSEVPRESVIKVSLEPTTEVKKAPSTSKSIKQLVEEGRITAAEGAPYEELIKKMAQLNKAATTRHLTKAEMDLAGSIETKLRDFLVSKNLTAKKVDRTIKGTKPKDNYRDLTDQSVFDNREMKLSETLEQEQAVNDALILVDKIRNKKVSRKDRKTAHTDLVNLSKSMEIKNPFTARRILDLLKYNKPTKGGTPDQIFAEQYGLNLKDDGSFLELNTKGEPSFTKEFLDENPSAKGKTPSEFWRDTHFKKDLEAHLSFKTAFGEDAIEGFKKMSEDPEYGLIAKTAYKALQKILVDHQDPWLKEKMGGNAGKSYIFNTLMNPRGKYLENKMFGGINLKGHFESQPKSRIIGEVEGLSKEQIAEIDRKTIEDERVAELARAGRDRSTGESDELSSSQDQLPEGVQKTDLAGMNIADVTQSEKMQDLTKFEMKLPSLLYKELTGKNPPKEALVRDGIALAKDIMSTIYSRPWKKDIKMITKEGKTKWVAGEKIKKPLIDEDTTYIYVLDPETGKRTKKIISGGWKSLTEQMLKESKK